MRAADWAWIAVAATVVSYEAFAAGRRDHELLSEAMDRYRRHHPVAVNSAIFYLAGHLSRVWPRRIDPLHRLAAVFPK
jgi:hypothetical protein